MSSAGTGGRTSAGTGSGEATAAIPAKAPAPVFTLRAARSELPSAERMRRHTREERMLIGRASRQRVRREAHGEWTPAPDRPDPVALLEEQGATRVRELVPIRHGRMAASPFAFFRGGALIMAADLASTPDSGIVAQLCGDAHLSNFGLFASPERHMLFDINDFDETLPGPWEWDVKRLAASFEVAGRELALAPADRRAVVLAAVREYRRAMRLASEMGVLEAWYSHLTADDVMAMVDEEVLAGSLTRKEGVGAHKLVEKARSRVHQRAFERLVHVVDGDLRIAPDPPLIVPIDDLVKPGARREDTEDWAMLLVDAYRASLADSRHPLEEFRYVDTARKVVGVGSVGTRCWIDLFVGRDMGNPLFLQTKEAPPSVLERFLGASEFSNAGRRVVAGQRLMQAASDIFLGWLRFKDVDGETRDYYVRQLHDWKGSVEIDNLRLGGATLYARLCGSTLARAHARACDRIAVASYLGKGDAFDKAVADFARAYADQNERDYETFRKAIATGRLEAETGL
jgi:uncharacterized protein (DUF2252 family)